MVRDLHGQGKVYDAMINYLKSIEDDVKLYILGDIIDRGEDSIRILQDVMYRKDIDITLLAGNHELFFYQYLNTPYYDRTWLFDCNGGNVTCEQFNNLTKREQCNIVNYLDNLPISVKLEGLGDYENVYLGHARTLKNTDLKLKDSSLYNKDYSIPNILWYRDDTYCSNGVFNSLNIIGHTPALLFGDCDESKMFRFKNDVLNIDGGCCFMDETSNQKLVSPLIEIDYDRECIFMLGYNKDGELVDLHEIDLTKDKEKRLSKRY